jgi:hypothetical protein
MATTVVDFALRNNLLRHPLPPTTARALSYPNRRPPPSRYSHTVGQSRPASLGTNDAYRAKIARLIDLGVTQQFVADLLGRHKSWLSRWLRATRLDVINADGMDAVDRYLAELHRASEPVDRHHTNGNQTPANARGQRK